jgi:membrane associated rhomboid family serine protease
MNQFRPSSFPVLPPVIKNLLIINVLVFLAQYAINGSGIADMENLFGLHHVKSPLFQPWQIITHLFLHSTTGLGHIFFNMFSLWMFGAVLEDLWGSKRFLTFYIISGLGAALLHLTFLWIDYDDMLNQFVVIKQHATPENVSAFFYEFKLSQFRGATEVLGNYVSNPDDRAAGTEAVELINQFVYLKLSVPTIGASGAIAGVMAAFMYLFPNTELYLYFLFPIKAKWLGIVYFGQELFFAITKAEGDNVAHWAHLGGALVGFLLVLTWNRNNRRHFY